MSNRLDLWGRRSQFRTDAGSTPSEAEPTFRPTFRRPSRQSSPDISEEEVKAEPSTDNSPVTTVPLDDNERVDAPIDPLEVDRRTKPYRRGAEHKARRRAMSISVLGSTLQAWTALSPSGRGASCSGPLVEKSPLVGARLTEPPNVERAALRRERPARTHTITHETR